jgi:hypothetical protein
MARFSIRLADNSKNKPTLPQALVYVFLIILGPNYVSLLFLGIIM